MQEQHQQASDRHAAGVDARGGERWTATGREGGRRKQRCGRSRGGEDQMLHGEIPLGPEWVEAQISPGASRRQRQLTRERDLSGPPS